MAIGVTIQDTVNRTGLTVKQVRYLVRKDRVRYRRHGGRILLHPTDVAALADNAWSGNPVEACPGKDS